MQLYLEDLHVGQRFGSGKYQMTAERIKAFAAEFDPQPFHLDEAAAAGTIFRGLAASGLAHGRSGDAFTGRSITHSERHYRFRRRDRVAQSHSAGRHSQE